MLVSLAFALSLALAACEADTGPTPTPEPDPEPTPTATASVDRTLTFGVHGSEEEVAAYRSLVAVYNSLDDDVQISVDEYASRNAFLTDVRKSGRVPDVFLASGRDLAWLQQERLVQAVDSLLIERGVDFGDLYSRDAVLAFSADTRLQCMPVGISPMVLYYNTELVDFDRMEQRGRPVPDEERLTWNFEAFTAAAEFASRPRRGTRGIHVEPTLEALAPWVYAAGGELYDDPVSPTTLTLSGDDTRAALETVLGVLRDPRLTLSDEQLQRRSALEWFERGKLAMLPGYRGLVPRLREVEGLQFDVIAMPSIERSATVGDTSGMCVSADTGNVSGAADFLVHMTSPVSVRRVTAEGSLVPAHLGVALSRDFLQPGLAPDHARAFTNSLRTIVLPPLLTEEVALEQAVHRHLDELLTAPILADLDALTVQIDEASREVLDPEGLNQESPSESPSEEESESP